MTESAAVGNRFLYSTEEMLLVSREIEQASIVEPEQRLYVGVQHSDHLLAQDEVYAMLHQAGVQVTAFGIDEGHSVAHSNWIQVPDDDSALSASWFLLRGGESSHAVVAFEVTGRGQARRYWEGFETRDATLIEAMIAHLEALTAAA